MVDKNAQGLARKFIGNRQRRADPVAFFLDSRGGFFRALLTVCTACKQGQQQVKEAVTEAMAFYKIPMEHIIVISDDISLEPGRMRIRAKGSDGGHNGLKNIIYLSGRNDFPRIRLGVGAKPHPDYDLADWVLGRFGSEDLKKLQTVFDHIPDAVGLIIKGKTQEAMARICSFTDIQMPKTKKQKRKLG